MINGEGDHFQLISLDLYFLHHFLPLFQMNLQFCLHTSCCKGGGGLNWKQCFNETKTLEGVLEMAHSFENV